MGRVILAGTQFAESASVFEVGPARIAGVPFRSGNPTGKINAEELIDRLSVCERPCRELPENRTIPPRLMFRTDSGTSTRTPLMLNSPPERMDATVANTLKQPTFHHLILSVCLALTGLVGCEGKSLVDSNPVFANAPPRRSLTNNATLAQSQDNDAESVVKTVSYDTTSQAPLTGNTVVAEVNGTPIFVDDLIGSVRVTLDEHPEIPADQKRNIMLAKIRESLDRHVEQEIVLQNLNAVIPEDRQQLVEDSLTEAFETEVLQKIREDSKATTDAELEAILAKQGLSIDLLREAFFRVQKVNGFLSQRAEAPDEVDRAEIVQYYKDHLDEFTQQERVRWQELVLKYSYHGGKQQTAKAMLKLIQELKAGADFGALAAKHSDALSAEKKGDMGWLIPGSLADKDLEKELWSIPAGQTTKIYERDDQLELYRVVEHQAQKTESLQSVQHQIEEKLKSKKFADARKKVLEELKENAIVTTIFDEEVIPDKSSFSPFNITR